VAGSWLVCVQFDDHAAARCQAARVAAEEAAQPLLRLTGWQVLEPTVVLQYQPYIPTAVRTAWRTDDELRNRRST
jgi:hypothetical protein